jgi:2-(1,2-epoxy-1,2-dihydrophenyl)acetyl-CoA isomerase
MSTEEETQSLLASREGRVMILTLNRTERLNALTPLLHRELSAAIQAAAVDPDIGAVILTGAGRAFCSGGDMGARKNTDVAPQSLEAKADELSHHGATAKFLRAMSKPTIAMVNGVAAGAGLALALACDLRIASRDAVLTTSYVKVAMSGDLGISYSLVHLVGSAKARELLFLGEKLDAAEALRIGLINRVVEPDMLRSATLDLARQLAEGPAIALRYIKRNLALAETASLDEVIEAEAYAMARCARTHDVKEAAIAFRDKRPPAFKGQ